MGAWRQYVFRAAEWTASPQRLHAEHADWQHPANSATSFLALGPCSADMMPFRALPCLLTLFLPAASLQATTVVRSSPSLADVAEIASVAEELGHT